MNNSSNATVAITRCTSYQPDEIATAMQKNLAWLGGLESFVEKGDSVLIKPNLIAPRNTTCPAQTHPQIILAVAKMVKDCGGKPFVGDSPAWGTIGGCVRALEMQEPLKHLGVPVRLLNKPKRIKIDGSRLGISTIALDADKIINLPKFKSHQQLGATFAVKNMFGCVSGKQKALWHFIKGKRRRDFSKMLIEIYQTLNPALTIIDAVTVMQGPGPISGTARELGFIVSGTDPIGCEILCSELINLPLDNLPIVKTAKRMGFGCSSPDKLNIVGDDYRPFICRDFKFAQQIPLRFTLPRVCKSIVKQIILQLRSIFSGQKEIDK
ncbi:MAG: DUF362 domain-containing protein [Sedimentisphaerales bacterium]|nr:DUF362 domain-containing protein [Sedimentisphaerales bacterium]